MAQIDSKELLADMNTYLSEAETAAAEAEADTALPFETIDEYFDDPKSFGEVTAKLLKKVSAVFDLAVKYNRHSPEYLKSCAQLEKGIKYLGSACLQKYALVQHKYPQPMLSELNTANLYTMAAIHFNKIDKALTEYMEEKHAVDDALLDMEYRYYHLMDRIRATDVKLYNYDMNRFYRKEDFGPLVHGLAFSEKTWTTNAHLHDKPMAFQRARAFSCQESGVRIQESGARIQDSVAGGQESGFRIQDSAVSGQQSAVNELDSAVSGLVSDGNCLPAAAGEPDSTVVEFGVGGGDISDEFDAGDELSEAESFLSDDPVDTRMWDGSETDRESEASDDVWTNGSEADRESDDPDGVWMSDSSETDHESDNPDDSRMGDASDTAGEKEMPECIRIMTQVIYRSRLQNLDYLGFTEREMRFLAADPFFAQIEPQMAADIRKALAEHESTGPVFADSG